MTDTDDASLVEKVNHIYLMPFPRKEDYDLFVQAVPPESEIDAKFKEIEGKVEALIRSERLEKQVAGAILGEFILENDLVKVVHNKYDVVIHYPSQLEELDAFERVKECLTWIKERNVVQFLMKIGGGAVSTLFGQWYMPIVLGPHIAKDWRATRAYDVLLARGDDAVKWKISDDRELETEKHVEQISADTRDVRFEEDTHLTQILEWLTLPEGKRRRHNSLIRYCVKHEDLKEFVEFYKGRAL